MGDQLVLPPVDCPSLGKSPSLVEHPSSAQSVAVNDHHNNNSGEEPGGQSHSTCPPPAPAQCLARLANKKKHRRRRPSKKKRRWKPYFKLSWEEKKLLDEKESVRAARTRAEMFAKGFTVAPYNTTQFLMEEHNQEEPDLHPNPGGGPAKRAGKSDETSEEEELPDEEDDEQDSGSDGMGGDGSEFLQRDFCETYEKYHAESLQNMSKQELIREYLELEKCLSRLEDEKNRLRCRLDAAKATRSGGGGGDAAAEKQMTEIQHEVEKLKAENARLQKENELCKRERFLENGE